MLKKEKRTELKSENDKVKWSLSGLLTYEKVILNSKNTWIFSTANQYPTWIYNGWILGKWCSNNTFFKNLI